jgi:hypothetical protein
LEIALLFTCIALPLWLNVKASILIGRDTAVSRSQKSFQYLLVWFVPILGAMVVLGVHRANEKPTRRYREDPDPGDDFSFSGKSLKSIKEALDGDD